MWRVYIRSVALRRVVTTRMTRTPIMVWRVWTVVLACVVHVYASVWDAEAFGRGRLPRDDDRIRALEWGQLQVLHTTDIHGCA